MKLIKTVDARARFYAMTLHRSLRELQRMQCSARDM